MASEEELAGLAKLREPFTEKFIGLLPRAVQKNDNDRGKCEPSTPRYSADRKFCGGYHARSVHLEFVGHAAVTDRLLAADPFWTWEPVAEDQAGLPLIVNGSMWIKLTVCGVTRLGFGDAGGKQGADATKEIIGDALRNAAMRFGVALDLWHKGDLHDETETSAAKVDAAPDWMQQIAAATTEAQLNAIYQDANGQRMITDQLITALTSRKTELLRLAGG